MPRAYRFSFVDLRETLPRQLHKVTVFPHRDLIADETFSLTSRIAIAAVRLVRAERFKTAGEPRLSVVSDHCWVLS